MRKITCHKCGILLCEVLPGAKIRKEGFYALCLNCKSMDTQKGEEFNVADFLKGFRK